MKLFEACTIEVVQLHEFFADWFNARLPQTAENFDRLKNVLHPEFQIISPDSRINNTASLGPALWIAHGSQTKIPGFNIEIRKIRLGFAKHDMVHLTYEEWQLSDHKADNTARLSTAIFEENPAAPNRVVWRHLHETWLADENSVEPHCPQQED